jgi:tRNA-dihydrouridine synthase B
MTTFITLGKQTFLSNLIQGPMAGYSCWPMRLLAQQWGQPAFCYTEMLSAKNLATQREIELRFRIKHPQEGPLCVQLSGTDPTELARAVERVIDFGADLIDLNCGCPVGKIRKKGAGSKLLENPDLLTQLIKAMKSVTNIPVSIKIRVDGDQPVKYSREAVLRAQDAGIDFITIHGRHWTEDYDIACRQDQIAEIVAALTIPVIANGDAHDTASTLTLLKNTGAAGVMISRAGVGQPWLFAQIRAEAAGQTFTPPPLQEIGELFLQHVRGLIELEGEKIAVLQARKLIKYYARALTTRTLILEQVNTVERYDALTPCVTAHFTP